MLAFFLIVFVTSIVVPGAAFILLDGITLKEFGCIVAACCFVAAMGAGAVSCMNTSDTEVWNGVVTSKKQVSVPCSHSYQCNCRNECSGSGKNRTCSYVCDTCYEHTNDWDWDVYTSNSETITIDRVDRRGSHEPPRFTATRMGEPTAVTHDYTNYIKASPDTLFRHQGLKEKYAATFPTYPQRIYDYYRLDRVVPVGFTVPDLALWNADLTKINSELGSPKQVNIIVVLTKNKPDEWFNALEEAWIGGKKNDVVLVVSTDDQMKPQWVHPMAWTSNELFKVKLRDDVMDMPSVTRESLMSAVATNVKQRYVRKPMKDFEYLKSSIVPTMTEWVVTLIISLLLSSGLVYVFQTQDVFDEERRAHFNFRSRY